MYAAVVEDAIAAANLERAANALPAGLRLHEEVGPDAVEGAENLRRGNNLGDHTLIHFADDTYALGAREDHVSYALTILARRLKQDEQHISTGKSEYMATGTTGKFKVQIRTDEELLHYMTTHQKPSTGTGFDIGTVLVVLSERYSCVDGLRT